MVEANRFKLGLFVVTAFLLALAAFFVLGLSELFEEKLSFMTVFDESVQGLDVGAPVKYRGVSIGKVTRIAIMPSKKGKDNLVKVNMIALPAAVDPSVADYGNSKDAKEEFFHEFFTREVDNGLRCRIDMAGITGAKYIEIDYFANDAKAAVRFTPPPGIFFLPSTPSLFRELSKNISQAIYKISSIDYKKISKEIETTLTTVNRHLNDPKIAKMIERLDTISSNLEITSKSIKDSVTTENMRGIIDQMKSGLEAFNNLTKDIQTELAEAKLDQTTADVRRALKAAIKMRHEISETLDAMIEFIQYMDQDPSSLIHGKQRPKIKFKNNE